MSEPKFTKGPWRTAGGESFISSSNGDVIAEMEIHGDYYNAHLIAAAPEMYEALEWLECYAEVQVRRHQDAEDSKNWALVLSALAKARGEQ